MFFVYDDKVYTSPLRGTILNGVTRRSILALVEEMGLEVVEHPLAVEDIMEGAVNGRLKEAFGTGTACVVSPVGQFTYKDETVSLGNGQMGVLTTQLYNTLTGIQYGTLKDNRGWVLSV